MKIELANYKLTPKVCLVGKKQTVKIVPKGAHAKFLEENDYTLEVIPLEKSRQALLKYTYKEEFKINQDGSIEFTYLFDSEQRYIVRVLSSKARCKQLLFKMYAANQDLYERRPLKGDLHTHSYYSDGAEEPVVVAANYRKNAYDFMGMTDHSEWFPSKECIDKYKEAGIATDLKMFYGEEIHVHGGYIHAVNFGGKSSVNEYYNQNTEKSIEEAKILAKNSPFSDEINAIDYGRRQWIANKIKETGGLAILVHPHWINEAYNMRDEMCDALFENNVYDAFELLGGQSIEENTAQIALYYDQIAKGRKINVVGSSDSHGTEPEVYFKEEFTIAFVKGDENEDVLTAIKDGYSIAVEEYKGQEHRCHGNLRLSRFSMFLMDEFYPEYKEICFEQGRLMKNHMTNQEDCKEILNLLQGRAEKYYKEFYGK